MLIPGCIPDHEPVIRAGILLPGDGRRKVHMRLPASPAYRIVGPGGSMMPESGAGLAFMTSGRGIGASVDGKEAVAGTLWRVQPAVPGPDGPGSGIRVHDVTAGRGFHWTKWIDVSLPGAVEIRRRGDVLLVVNELPFEAYIACVTASEMGAACPSALIESQTIVARSWMLAAAEGKHRDLGIDACNDDCCQRYQGTTHLTDRSMAGALGTRGRVLLHGGAVCDARYSKCCGGATEAFEHVWGGGPLPYLPMRPDAPEGFRHGAYPPDTEARARRWIEDSPDVFCGPGHVPQADLRRYLGGVDEEGLYFRWQKTLDPRGLAGLLNEKLGIGTEAVLSLRPLDRGGSCRITRLAVDVTGSDGKAKSYELAGEYRIRECLDRNFLYSSAFVVNRKGRPEKSPEAFVLLGAGWGHGSGYCQMGALGMALAGYGTEAILAHYFPGAESRAIY